MSVKPIPDGYHTVTPYLVVRGGAKAIEFYKAAFGAEELMRMDGPGGTIAHAEIKIGDSIVMLSDEWPDHGYKSPQSYGGTSTGFMIYVPDADAAFAKALTAGAAVLKPLQDQFWGDRMGSVTDPFGHNWTLATHVEDVSPEECARRFAAFQCQQQEAA